MSRHYRRVISHCFYLRTVGKSNLNQFFFGFFLIPGDPNLSKKSNTPNPSSNSKHSSIFDPFFFLGEKNHIPQQNQQNHGCLSTSQAEPPGASERSGWRLSGSAPNSGPSLPAPGRMGMEGRIFAQIFLGAKQKTHIFQPLSFFFKRDLFVLGGSRIFGIRPLLHLFFFSDGWEKLALKQLQTPRFGLA